MGRQAYLNRLALGRSPYEPPETAAVDPSSPVRRVSNVHADSYMQQYDARGHPVNPESKTLGRELRRAKNDILSTMGIVVSGEDRNANTSNEQQKINEIAAENDFGLVITTLDQLFVFFGTWWTSSLTGRIQTYRHYNHTALLDVVRSERGSTGIFGFYFAGIPAWAVSSGLAIARDNPLKRIFITVRDYCLEYTGKGGLSLVIRSLFGLTYSIARSSVLVFSVQAYMYSLLQTLSLVPARAIPGLRLMMPFGPESLLGLPSFPSGSSFSSISGFLVRLLASPGFLTFLYAFYLRPELEERIYRLVRRQLPKPTLADELSIRVAYEENLIEWIVPTLGRRADEETRRAKLTLLQDIKDEFKALRRWVSSLFGLFPRPALLQQATEGLDQEKIDDLRNSIESLQHELEEVQLRNNLRGVVPDGPLTQPLGPTATTGPVDVGQSDLPDERGDVQMNAAEFGFGMNQVLTNENRMSLSPGEMSSDYVSEMATIGRTSAPSGASNTQSQLNNTRQEEVSTARDRQNSRSNTLFSRPSSPETSPPTSPRVRASLIHQSSDIITMQLELLGNRNRNPQNQTSAPTPRIPRLGGENAGLRSSSAGVDRRPIAEFLEALILSQAQHQAAQQSVQVDHDGLSSTTAGASFTTAHAVPTDSEAPNTDQDVRAAENHPDPSTVEETTAPVVPNILPDGVEEPNDDETGNPMPPPVEQNEGTAIQTDEFATRPPPDTSLTQGQPLPNQSSIAHRVTLLSAHPVDSLASHIAAILSTIILSPLETLCLRSLAHSYLTLHPSVTAKPSDLYPTSLWFGGHSWPDALAYTGRLLLMRGMQAALRAGVWGFLVGSTMRIGRKFCGWGAL
ncbi:uncharacterized protein N7459_009281 [Penicillium hispanicum]|uniref:uncharacterized protein n=1 Tax=Penicillium hispanicum TaxID=1080232 RepID=UPI0025418466|nr:uncharacterized protein N7459_009281 [Penicillium hispanicum]KAJ5569851.1 hypothetical protein N7459_009281 [Penicillium hispanicum]